jgi:hypothetical protein
MTRLFVVVVVISVGFTAAALLDDGQAGVV